jgi:hypothetical protein
VDDANRARLYSEVIQGIIAVARLAIYGTVFVLSVRYIAGAFMVYAGKQSYADLSLSLVGKLSLDRWLAYIFGSGGVAYGMLERNLRKSNIKRMRGQTSEFELRMDPKRTSSGLTRTGDTRREDR